jgi:hypothetical protein
MVFDPTTHPNILYYIPNFLDEPLDFWVERTAVATHPVNAGDLIGTIETDVNSLLFTASSDGVRPALAAGGGVQGASGKIMRVASDLTTAAPIHQNRKMAGVVVFRMNSGTTLASRPVLDNTDNSATAKGFTVGSIAQTSGQTIGGVLASSNTSSMRARINHGAGSALDLYTEEAVADNTTHLFWFDCDPDTVARAQVDNGRISYQTIGSTAGTGDAALNTFFLNRSAATQEFPGIVYAVGLYSDYPGDEYIQEWIDHFGLGTIAGSPEIRVGDFHYNVSKSQRYIPYCLWFKNKRVSPKTTGDSEDGEGTVFNDGVSGGDGWVGGPHGNETVSSKTIWVDGVQSTVTDGTIYEGGTIRVERQTVMGVSFNLVETITTSGNSKRTNAKLTRLGDARTFTSSFYMIRNARPLCDGYLVFNSAGAQTVDSTVSADVDCAEGTIAVAQWFSATSMMILTVLTKGQELDNTFRIVNDTYNHRIYNMINDMNTTVEDDVREMEVLSKHYETTAGAWKALAATELGLILNPPKYKRINMGIGLGL